MKKTAKLFGIIALEVIIGFSLIACPDGNDSGTTPETHTHNWGAWTQTTASTCTTAGEETRTCTLNPAHTETKPVAINPDAHNWGGWMQTKAPTEIEDGEETRTCVFNSAHKETRPISALGHTHNWGAWTQTTAPTCTTAGEETRTCTLNPAHTETKPVAINPDAHGDMIDTTIAQAPTFTSAGTMNTKCEHDCGHTGTRPIDSLAIKTTADWTAACAQLLVKTGDYTLTISDEESDANGGIGVAGSTADTFGSTPSGSLSVTLKGSGKLYLTSQGNLFRIAANQALIIDSEDLVLEGLTKGQNGASQDNNTGTIYVGTNGKLELKNGTISGNAYTNGGVRSSGSFTMSGGSISGNSRSGVALFGDSSTMSSFTMTGGTISGNGSGVYVAGCDFTMSGGTISGNILNTSFYQYVNGVSFNDDYSTGYTGTFTISGNAYIDNLVIHAPALSIASDWTGGVGRISLGRNFDTVSQIRNWWEGKVVLKAVPGYTLTAADVARFPLGIFVSEAVGVYSTISSTHKIAESGADIGKLVLR